MEHWECFVVQASSVSWRSWSGLQSSLLLLLHLEKLDREKTKNINTENEKYDIISILYLFILELWNIIEQSFNIGDYYFNTSDTLFILKF